MKPQFVQPPNFRDNYTLALTPDELSLLKTALIDHLAHGDLDQEILDALYSKLQLTLSSDGACLRPAQPLEAVVEQGGSISKYADYSDDELENELEFLLYENGRVARGHASQVSESLKEALEEKALRPLLIAGICNFPEKMTARSGGPRCQFCELIYLEAPGCEGCRFHTAKVSDVTLPEEVGQGGIYE